jgi:hypothetical protein
LRLISSPECGTPLGAFFPYLLLDFLTETAYSGPMLISPSALVLSKLFEFAVSSHQHLSLKIAHEVDPHEQVPERCAPLRSHIQVHKPRTITERKRKQRRSDSGKNYVIIHRSSHVYTHALREPPTGHLPPVTQGAVYGYKGKATNGGEVHHRAEVS